MLTPFVHPKSHQHFRGNDDPSTSKAVSKKLEIMTPFVHQKSHPNFDGSIALNASKNVSKFRDGDTLCISQIRRHQQKHRQNTKTQKRKHPKH